MTDENTTATLEPHGIEREVRHTPLESYAVLGAMLAQVANCPGWEPKMFTQGVIGWDGVVALTLNDHPTAVDLAGQLHLSSTTRTTQRPISRYAGHNTAQLDHVAVWTGVQAGHRVQLTAIWHSPLGDVDVAEGEFLA